MAIIIKVKNTRIFKGKQFIMVCPEQLGGLSTEYLAKFNNDSICVKLWVKKE